MYLFKVSSSLLMLGKGRVPHGSEGSSHKVFDLDSGLTLLLLGRVAGISQGDISRTENGFSFSLRHLSLLSFLSS